jgi:hypothetical protein
VLRTWLSEGLASDVLDRATSHNGLWVAGRSGVVGHNRKPAAIGHELSAMAAKDLL